MAVSVSMLDCDFEGGRACKGMAPDDSAKLLAQLDISSLSCVDLERTE